LKGFIFSTINNCTIIKNKRGDLIVGGGCKLRFCKRLFYNLKVNYSAIYGSALAYQLFYSAMSSHIITLSSPPNSSILAYHSCYWFMSYCCAGSVIIAPTAEWLHSQGGQPLLISVVCGICGHCWLPCWSFACAPRMRIHLSPPPPPSHRALSLLEPTASGVSAFRSVHNTSCLAMLLHCLQIY